MDFRIKLSGCSASLSSTLRIRTHSRSHRPDLRLVALQKRPAHSQSSQVVSLRAIETKYLCTECIHRCHVCRTNILEHRHHFHQCRLLELQHTTVYSTSICSKFIIEEQCLDFRRCCRARCRYCLGRCAYVVLPTQTQEQERATKPRKCRVSDWLRSKGELLSHSTK